MADVCEAIMMTAGRNRGAILTYHSLDESGSVISVRPEMFRAQMEALAASGAKAVPLDRIFDCPGAVAITFDDGFANFADYAVPVLERLALPATVFIVSGYCGRRNRWPAQPSGIPDLPLMSWNALRDLPPSIALGAHTRTHPDLRGLNERDLSREVLDGRHEIEQKTGRPVGTFAYPYGAVDARARVLAGSEFRVACGTYLAFVEAGSDRAAAPRLDTYYLKSTVWPGRLFSAPTALYIAFRRSLRQARTAAAGR